MKCNVPGRVGANIECRAYKIESERSARRKLTLWRERGSDKSHDIYRPCDRACSIEFCSSEQIGSRNPRPRTDFVSYWIAVITEQATGPMLTTRRFEDILVCVMRDSEGDVVQAVALITRYFQSV